MMQLRECTPSNEHIGNQQILLWIKKSSRGINNKLLSDQKHVIHYSPSVVAVLTVTVAVAIPIAVAVLAAPVAAAVP